VNKFYRVTGTAVAALTLAASAAAFGAPYAAGRAAAPRAVSAAQPAPHPNIPAALPTGVAASSIGGIKKVGSQNWAGYAVTGGKFRKIRATFYVPIMNCAGVPDTFSSHWVGLDGFNSNTVEQEGIESDCIGGKQRIFAWREVFPRAEQPFTTLKIRPGDSITATTTFLRSTHKFKLRVKNNTTGQHRTVRQRCAGAICHRTSAEVISEAPTVNGQQSALAPYGAQAYSAIRITNGRGKSGGIRNRHWTAFRIFQIGKNSGHLIAAPTPLHGPAFAVYRLGDI
jgi:Peptidase A4 family